MANITYIFDNLNQNNVKIRRSVRILLIDFDFFPIDFD